jgi:drug/metabolite transporter (DMT)-like permease
MTRLWLLFAFCGPVSWAVSTHIDKYLVDKYFRDSDTAVLLVFTALLGLIALPVIWFFDPGVLTLSALAVGVMTVSGVLYMGALLFYLRAIQSAEASVVAPLFQLSVLFTLLLGFLLLGETLSTSQLFGLGLIIGGALVLSVRGRSFLRGLRTRLVALMAAATFIVSLSSVVFKYFAVEETFWGTTFWTFVGEALFGFAILAVPAYRRQFIALFKKSPEAVIGVNAANEVVNLGGGLSVRYASLLAPVALVSAVSSTTTLFVFVFGVLLTLFVPKLGREDLSRANFLRKGFSAVLVSIGVMLANHVQ